MNRNLAWLAGLAFAVSIALVGCGGGDDGATGPAGAKGADGTDFPGPLPAAYVAADGVAGGSVYDQWYTTLAGGSGTLAGYGYTYDGAADGADPDFVRCKACHGWDGLGTMGSYVNRAANATRPTVAAVNLRSTIRSVTPQALFDLIKGQGGRHFNAGGAGHPDYTGLLTDSQIWNLVKAMREAWLNPNDLYTITVNGVYSTGTRTFSNVGTGGNAANGDALITSKCAGCHGADGRTILIDTTLTLGAFLRANPHEAWLKMKFGQPGSTMPKGLLSTVSDIRDVYLALQDSVKYPN